MSVKNDNFQIDSHALFQTDNRLYACNRQVGIQLINDFESALITLNDFTVYSRKYGSFLGIFKIIKCDDDFRFTHYAVDQIEMKPVFALRKSKWKVL